MTNGFGDLAKVIFRLVIKALVAHDKKELVCFHAEL